MTRQAPDPAAGREQGPDRRALEHALDRWEQEAGARRDDVLATMVAAGKSALEQWLSAVAEREAARHSLDETASAASAAGQRLAEILGVLDRLAAAAVSADPADPADPAGRTGLVAHPELVGAQSVGEGLQVRMLGGFEVVAHGRAVPEWNGRRAHSVLQYLLLNRGRPATRDVLVDAIWPDADPDSGRRRLHQAVYALRQAVDREDVPGAVVCANGTYALSPRVPVRTDVDDFLARADDVDRAAAAGEDDGALLVAAVRAYPGDLLPDEADAEWVVVERERLSARFVDLGTRLTRRLDASGAHQDVVPLASRVLAVDPWNEPCLLLQLKALAAVGDVPRALRTYRRYEQELLDELGIVPAGPIQRFHEQLLAARGGADALPATAAPTRAPTTAPTTAPTAAPSTGESLRAAPQGIRPGSVTSGRQTSSPDSSR